MANTGFVCHDDYLNKTAKLTDEEVGRLFRACMKYHSTGELVTLDGRESVAFDFIKEDIDRAERAYKEKCEQNRRNRNARNVDDGQQPSTFVNDCQRSGVNNKNKNNNKNNNKKKSVFTPPTREEVQAYCVERGNRVSADRFVDYYTSNGWMVGKNHMKDWRATVRTWERSDGMKQTVTLFPQNNNPAQDYHQRDLSGAQDAAFERMMAMEE